MLIAPGVTYLDNVQDLLSAPSLDYFLSSCTVTGIAVSDFNTSSHVVQVSATVPVSDQGQGSLWFDSTLNLFRHRFGNRWASPGIGASMVSSFAGIMPQGAWVAVSGDTQVAPTLTALWPETMGVLVATSASLVDMVVARTGIQLARVVGPVKYGDTLVAFTGAFGSGGYAGAATMLSGFGNTTFTAGLEIGLSLGQISTLTTGLITCLIWR